MELICHYTYQPKETNLRLAQPAGAVECTDCISAERLDFSTNECPVYDSKQSDGEAPIMLDL